MKFIEFKKNLEKCDINLFDYDYRISYYNMKILTTRLDNLNQSGGGYSNNYYVKPFTILKMSEKKENNKIRLIIDNLLSNNFIGAEYLCKQNVKLNYF